MLIHTSSTRHDPSCDCLEALATRIVDVATQAELSQADRITLVRDALTLLGAEAFEEGRTAANEVLPILCSAAEAEGIDKVLQAWARSGGSTDAYQALKASETRSAFRQAADACADNEEGRTLSQRFRALADLPDPRLQDTLDAFRAREAPEWDSLNASPADRALYGVGLWQAIAAGKFIAACEGLPEIK
jgi:hypothetical protein